MVIPGTSTLFHNPSVSKAHRDTVIVYSKLFARVDNMTRSKRTSVRCGVVLNLDTCYLMTFLDTYNHDYKHSYIRH